MGLLVYNAKKHNLKSCYELIFIGVKSKEARNLNTDVVRIPVGDLEETKKILPNIPNKQHPGRKGYDDYSNKNLEKAANLSSEVYKMDERGRNPFNIITEEICNIIDCKKPRGKESIKEHSTQKPVAIIEWLLKLSTKEGDLVLDCFGGTGTTAIACVNLKRDFIISDKEEKYVEIIKNRLKENGFLCNTTFE